MGILLESHKGIYKTQKKYVFFKDNVSLIHKDYQIFSDSLIYIPQLRNPIYLEIQKFKQIIVRYSVKRDGLIIITK